ncbi:hypothetical protein PIB30_068611 [Stylosanthes scabra]|uniref:VQ domain-containing protein n=1 Tax=Stylosanthes scabra TaxID=79078 RepID=A0ABU6XPB5_9FABA|nr:hypothetical protein [Stylosanthes scabra]
MTKKLQQQTCNNNNTPSSSACSKHLTTKDSYVISKLKPKIRIIHIYAPEIIKTDAANFRELVQRLTGKPEDEKRKVAGKTKSINTAPTKKVMMMKKTKTKKNFLLEEEDEQEFLSLQNETMVKNEHEEEREDLLRRSSCKLNEEKLSGFLDGFSELDGFIEELCTVPVVDQN